MTIFIRDARALTLADGSVPRRGKALGDLAIIPRADALISNGVIVAIEPVGEIRPPADARVIEANGRVLMPGFVDAHTHAYWAGDRLDEWRRKLAGEPYLDILKAGGGIMSTVRAVRAASQARLEELLRARLTLMLREGTTTVEVKSGYGLTPSDELKMLRAIRTVAGGGVGSSGASSGIAPAPSAASWRRPPAQTPRRTAQTITATALLGHAIDAGPTNSEAAREAFVTRTIEETLPAVAAEFPGVPIDAFCEEGAWSRAECARLFERALELGHPVRVHADQFNSLGMVRWAIDQSRDREGAISAERVSAERSRDREGAVSWQSAPHLKRPLPDGRGSEESARPSVRSADHLEATSVEDLRALAQSGLFGVALPVTGWHTDGRYMNARAFLDAPGTGGALVIATNCNPGSAPCSSMPFAIALAARHLGLTPAEAIGACTVNAAALLGLTDRAILAPGKRADCILLRHTDERGLAYEFGGNPVDLVVCGGEIVAGTD